MKLYSPIAAVVVVAGHTHRKLNITCSNRVNNERRHPPPARRQYIEAEADLHDVYKIEGQFWFVCFTWTICFFRFSPKIGDTAESRRGPRRQVRLTFAVGILLFF